MSDGQFAIFPISIVVGVVAIIALIAYHAL